MKTNIENIRPEGNPRWPHLGAVVRTTDHGHEGLVTGFHLRCPECRAWQDGLSVPLTTSEREGPWVSIATFTGGAVVVPVERVEIVVQAHEVFRAAVALGAGREPVPASCGWTGAVEEEVARVLGQFPEDTETRLADQV